MTRELNGAAKVLLSICGALIVLTVSLHGIQSRDVAVVAKSMNDAIERIAACESTDMAMLRQLGRIEDKIDRLMEK